MRRFQGHALVVVSLGALLYASRARAQDVPEEAPEEVVTVSAAPAKPESKSDSDNTSEPAMIVVGQRISEPQRLVQSAEAVQVVDTTQARQQTSDLGEVLARVQGVGIRREGGLGSNVRFSLNGLQDDQVRLFLDGVPLDQAGFPFGIANVPVNLIERVEIYRGVVPVRFGADALGGAVNLVTPDARQNYIGGSYQIGSFGTQRATVDGRFYDKESGFVFGHTAFLDVAKNDYKVNVEVGQDDGSQRLQAVKRFHDAYRAFGSKFEAGFVDRPWAKRLLLSGFVSSFDKEVQNDLWMTKAYGEATYRQDVYGSTLRYDVKLAPKLNLAAIANYSYSTYGLRDVSRFTYDWLGRQTSEKPNPKEAGEIGNGPTDQVLRQHTLFGRILGTWDVARDHTVRLSIGPQYITRRGRNYALAEPDAIDPQTASNGLLTVITGLEYQVNLVDDLVENVLFVKDYVYHAGVQQDLHAGAGLQSLSVDKHSAGFGDLVRVRATGWLDLKASYEYATRLPRADEVLGDGGLVLPNVKLEPEVSHNVNVGPRVAAQHTPIGKIAYDLNMFLREVDRLILLGSGGRTSTYANIYGARSMGLENALSWSAPSGIVSLDGSFTYQDFRNTSDSGQFMSTKGNRIPNRPYMFGSWSGRLRFDDVIVKLDSIEPFYIGRYVHGFYLAWESEGLRDSKLRVPDQVTHDIGVSWTFDNDVARSSVTLEAQNVTDARVYDNFGVQRPGRAFYAKLTASFR